MWTDRRTYGRANAIATDLTSSGRIIKPIGLQVESIADVPVSPGLVRRIICQGHN